MTKAEVAQLDRQLVTALEADHPQSARHAFYLVTSPTLEVSIPKTEDGYRKVQRRILKLRRAGVLDYGWIVDMTRAGYHVATYRSGAEFIEDMAGRYRATLWSIAEPVVEVWCESRSLAAVLEPECRRLAVSLYPASGFVSETLCYQAAEHINGLNRRSAVILYIGDYDPAGVLIDRDIEAKMRRFLRTRLQFRRLAITEEQIEAYALPTKPRKATDTRSPEVDRTVEGEAMPAAIMRQLLRDAIEAYLPPGALDAARAAEESERKGLIALAGAWAGSA